MRIIGKRKVAYGKRPDYKKAFVTFDERLADVGLGSRVDGLPGQEVEEENDVVVEGGDAKQQQQQIEA